MKPKFILEAYLEVLQEEDMVGASIAYGFAAMSAATLIATYARKFASVFRAKQVKKECSKLQGPDRTNCYQNVDNASLFQRMNMLKKLAAEKCPETNDPDACKKHIQGQIQSLFKARGAWWKILLLSHI